jgi:UDP-N-acetylglucosamine acyltransferase
LGELAFAAGGAMIEREVPPYVIVAGDRARIRGINKVGLARAGVPESSQKALEMAYRALFRKREPLALAARAISDELRRDPFVERLIAALTG